ncbi:hypothetical protein [Haloarcula saliterrae]|nr:hypothetical protein [Haloarcula sp. S1CR25-12]
MSPTQSGTESTEKWSHQATPSGPFVRAWLQRWFGERRIPGTAE